MAYVQEIIFADFPHPHIAVPVIGRLGTGMCLWSLAQEN